MTISVNKVTVRKFSHGVKVEFLKHATFNKHCQYVSCFGTSTKGKRCKFLRRTVVTVIIVATRKWRATDQALLLLA